MLEGALLRGEAKRSGAVRDRRIVGAYSDMGDGFQSGDASGNADESVEYESEIRVEGGGAGGSWDLPTGLSPDHSIDADFAGTGGAGEAVSDKAIAEDRWRALLEVRFVAGDDDEFDYSDVDEDESLDGGWRELNRQEDYFESEEESWDVAAEEADEKEELEGETGVQDF